jgi:beta-lactam-binding protein with PASTA domain
VVSRVEAGVYNVSVESDSEEQDIENKENMSNKEGMNDVKPQPKQSAGGNLKRDGGKTATNKVGVWSKMKNFYKRLPIISHIIFIGIFCCLLVGLLFWGLKKGTRHNKTIEVPNFVGMTIEKARDVAKDKELNIVVRDSIFDVDMPGGTIVDQLPGTSDVREVTVKPGRKIYVTINAYNRRKIPVPYVAKQTLRQSLNQLERTGLTIEKLVYQPDMTSTDYVQRQEIDGREIGPNSKQTTPVGTGVTLYVTYRRDEQNTSAPRLVGLSLAKAKASLWDHGLNVGKIVYDDSANDIVERRSARVYKQSVALGQSARRGATVDIYLSNDDALVDSLKIVADVEAKRMEAERRKQREKEQREADSLAALAQ